jgi:uncharacterized protein (DUF2252 family)
LEKRAHTRAKSTSENAYSPGVKEGMDTKAERREHGRRLRANCPRSSHSEWKPRSSGAVELLEESDVGRVKALVPVKYGRMSHSLFTFFRGSSIIQARDLASTPSSGITVQLCGDCHMLNFGGFATPERSLAFDINDFDETFPGPWEWDVKRLAVSLLLAARDRDFSDQTGTTAVRTAVASYRQHMAEFARETVLERWYRQIRFDDLFEFFSGSDKTLRSVRKAQTRAAKRTSESVFPKLTEVVDGHVRIVDDPPRISHEHKGRPGWEERAADVLRRYKAASPGDRQQLLERYELEDTAVKVVGVGSVGTRCFIALFFANQAEPLFLQMKEARRSVLESPNGKSRFAHQGQRVVLGQRLMQATSDIFLGWTEVPGEYDYYVRQLRDMKVSPDLAAFRPQTLVNFGTICGWALARAHARSGDPDAITGYLGSNETFDTAAVQHAITYADQVARDFAEFEEAIRSGRLPIEIEP